MPRFTIRPHHFIDGAYFVIDTKPTHRLAHTRDWTTAPLSIIQKLARECERESASLSDLISIADARACRLALAKACRKNEQRRRNGDLWSIPWSSTQLRFALSSR